jgi:GT2 family glycosyltransferase/glycosyltransferase involved in cell wall biosynthesis
MKLALVTPLPPLPSGISDYAAELLGPLRRCAEVSLFVNNPAQVHQEFGNDQPLRPLADLPHALARGEVDLAVYQIGNGRLHAPALRYVREQPGVLVLHDLVLHHLFAHLTLDNGWTEEYRALLVDEYGEAARGWPERLDDKKLGRAWVHRALYRLPLSRRLAQQSRGVVAHSSYVAGRLLRWDPGLRVQVIPPGVVLPECDRAAARARLGLQPGAFAVGICGGLDGNRRIEEALQGVLSAAAALPDLRLLLFGDERPEVAQRLAELGLVERARFLGHPHLQRYCENLSALDAAVSLRFPTCGETSGTAVRLMSVGVPFVTTDVDAFRELPDAAGVKLPVDSRLAFGIAETLLGWGRDPARARAAGAAGREHVARAHRLEDAARSLVAFCEEVRRRPPLAAAVPRRSWPKVEAITISYNGKQFIGACLRSLLDQDYPNLKVTVIDNASQDGSPEWIRANFPQVALIASNKNLGFAAGNNFVAERSDAEWFALLNQDAVARRNWVRELVEVGERRPEIAVTGSKMLMQRCPTILNSAGIWVNEAGWAVDRRIGERDDETAIVPEEVFGICGGAMLLRASAWREHGGFDEKFFMYFEDVDLCWRWRLAGLRMFYVPAAVVFHDWHGDRGAGDRAARRRFLCERNRWQSLFKNVELKTLVRLWTRMRDYDRLRLRVVADAIARGIDVPYFEMTGRAIRRAFRWALWHLPSIWWRRRAVQRRRRLHDGELHWVVQPGITEPSHVGDLAMIRDRFSAQGVSDLKMGRNDQDSLGPGWHPLEGDVRGDYLFRWSKGTAWFYLRPDRRVTRLLLHYGDRPTPTPLEILIDEASLGTQAMDGHSRITEFELPQPVAAGTLLEGRLVVAPFKPVEGDASSADVRELGLFVGRVWCE